MILHAIFFLFNSVFKHLKADDSMVQNNDDLILAIQAAGVERGRNGFHKQKAGEKLPESEENLLQHRTDGSDAFDTLYIGCEKFPQADTSYVAVDVNGIVQMKGVTFFLQTFFPVFIPSFSFFLFSAR